MGLSRFFALALFFSAFVLVLLILSFAQNTQAYLSLHNSAQAVVGVEPMTWDKTVATYAQNYANKRRGDCLLVHSGEPYGENIFWGSGREFTAADAMRSWVNEKKYYHYNSNTCQSGQQCGHYTQVVWRITRSRSDELGSGVITGRALSFATISLQETLLEDALTRSYFR